MSDVVIAGIGQVPAGEYWELSLRTLAVRAIQAARKDAGGLLPQALYVGNFMASVVSHQANLGALLTDWAALKGIEAYTIEAAEASGAGAFRMGYLAVASGFVDSALVVGVEKYTDMVGAEVNSVLAMAGDYDYEAISGLTPAGTAGLVMQRYLHTYSVPRLAFGALPMLAHANAVTNPNAMYRKAIRLETYEQSGMVSDPVNLFDMAPYADGAAAVLLTRRELLPGEFHHPLVKVSGSGTAIDTLALHDRPDMLAFDAARAAVEQACYKAGLHPRDMDLYELCDAFSIYGILSLEAAGFALPGEGWKLAQDGILTLNGALPVCTMGGMKACGNTLGASGVYQIVTAALQLRAEAGANQVPGARRALALSLGGPASTAVAHVLERV